MTLPVGKWQNTSFFSGFNYMRLILSGNYGLVGLNTTNITIPSGTYSPFVEVYQRNTATGEIMPVTGEYAVGMSFTVTGTTLTIKSVPGFPASTIYYFVYRSNL